MSVASSTPKIAGFGVDIPDEPCVMLSALRMICVIMMVKAIVVIARYRPFRRNDGIPTIKPKAAAISPLAGRQSHSGIP